MNKQVQLDELKLRLSLEILNRYTIAEIRTKSLANLARWKSQGTWAKVYDEWTDILENHSDDDIRSIMSGKTDRDNRLRQSVPYPGLLDQKTVEKLRKEVLRPGS